MTPAERLDAAEAAVDSVIEVMPPDSVAVAHALIAIGRYLQSIDNRQAGS